MPCQIRLQGTPVAVKEAKGHLNNFVREMTSEAVTAAPKPPQTPKHNRRHLVLIDGANMTRG